MDIGYNKYLLAADAIFWMHFAFAIFIVMGLPVIWIGYFAKFKFVKNLKFRICHTLAMGIVLCESLVGMICPLTEWENDLRIKGGEGQIYETSFIKEWFHNIMFFEFSERTFMIIYLLFFVLVLLTLWIIPPESPLKGNKP